MSSRVSFREQMQKLIHGRNEACCPTELPSELDTACDLNATVDVTSRCNFDAGSIHEPECEEPPEGVCPNADHRQQAVDLDSSVASAMTTLDASLTSIPETELMWLKDRNTQACGAVSEQGSATPLVRRTHLPSWSSAGGGVNGETDSFDSTVTDFDYLTSPGAQAERNAEYQQALQLAQHICAGSTGQVNVAQSGVSFPVAIPTVTMLPYQPVMPVLCVRTPADSQTVPPVESRAMPDTFKTCTQMQLRAQELEAYANQLMAQAMQAKASVLRMQTEVGLENCLQPASKQDGSACKKAQISLSNTVLEPDNLPVVSVNILPETERTTIMLRNLPNDYTRGMVLDLLDEHGFACCYDFIYVPMDNKRKVGLGYAFVNMDEAADATRAFDVLAGFSDWKVPGSAKVLEVAWGNPLQGLDAHVERYRNSPIMHPDVPEEFKPVVFEHGVRVEFPVPTQPVKAPRNR